MGPRGGCERDLLGPVMIRKGGSREARIATWMWTQFRTAMGGMGGTVVRVSRHNETSPIETFPSDACLRLSAIRYVGFSFPLFFAFFFFYYLLFWWALSLILGSKSTAKPPSVHSHLNDFSLLYPYTPSYLLIIYFIRFLNVLSL